MCGTHRTASGLLDNLAGKIKHLDELAYKYYSELPSREEIYNNARAYITAQSIDTDKKVRSAADYYIKAMERIKAKGDAWVEKEQTR